MAFPDCHHTKLQPQNICTAPLSLAAEVDLPACCFTSWGCFFWWKTLVPVIRPKSLSLRRYRLTHLSQFSQQSLWNIPLYSRIWQVDWLGNPISVVGRSCKNWECGQNTFKSTYKFLRWHFECPWLLCFQSQVFVFEGKNLPENNKTICQMSPYDRRHQFSFYYWDVAAKG